MSEKKQLTADEWLARLLATFKVNGIVGNHVANVEEMAAERQTDQFFRGQNVLLVSFQSFFVETLHLAGDALRSGPYPVGGSNYPIALSTFHGLFRRLRCCHILYISGYPLEAYALLRDAKDRALVLATIARNRLTFQEAFGIRADMKLDNDYDKVTRDNRQRMSNRIQQEVIGKSSGLSEAEQKDLEHWNDLFHLEVHQGLLSISREIMAIYKERRPPRIGPQTDREQCAVYVGRAAEIGWMVVRLLPYLQPVEGAFGADWSGKRDVLDDSFRFVIELDQSLDKRLAPLVVKLTNKRFRFPEPFYYAESTYKYP